MKILLVAYFFPPCRDTGAHRPESLAHHLSELGHDVTVLTTKAYGSLGTPGRDEDRGGLPKGSATAPVRASVGDHRGYRIVRTNDLQLVRARLSGADTVASMYANDRYVNKPVALAKLIVPEPLAAAWAPFAIATALRLQHAHRFDAVLTTSPPESTHLVGRVLRARGVRWVADLRDGWTFEQTRPPWPTRWQARLDRALEESVLGRADAVVGLTAPLASDIAERTGVQAAVVSNGWDPRLAEVADAGAGRLLDPDRRSLVYTGRFGQQGRNPDALVGALDVLERRYPEAAGRLELAIAGPLTVEEATALETAAHRVRLTLLGSVDRATALGLQRAADALLLVQQRSSAAPAKLFEYLAAGRPIVAVARGTEAGALVSAEQAGVVVGADEHDAIADALRSVADKSISSASSPASDRFAYPGIAKRIAGLLANL